MKIVRLGYGGAFDISERNSSMILEIEDNKILVDCGFTVYPELKKMDLISDINYVALTHLHDDHVGSLSVLIFDRWFMHKKSTTIICEKKVGESLEIYLSKICGHKKQEYKIIHEKIITNKSGDLLLDISPIDTFGKHVPNFPSSGFIFTYIEKEKPHNIIYSGDIAEPIFNSMNNNELLTLLNDSTICYHDVSAIDYPGAVHCFYNKLNSYNNIKIIGYHFNDKAGEVIEKNSNIIIE